MTAVQTQTPPVDQRMLDAIKRMEAPEPEVCGYIAYVGSPDFVGDPVVENGGVRFAMNTPVPIYSAQQFDLLKRNRFFKEIDPTFAAQMLGHIKQGEPFLPGPGEVAKPAEVAPVEVRQPMTKEQFDAALAAKKAAEQKPVAPGLPGGQRR